MLLPVLAFSRFLPAAAAAAAAAIPWRGFAAAAAASR
jgi:hypothetical protein